MDSCKVVLTFEPVAKLPAATNQLTPTCQYFLGALKKNFKGTGLPRTQGIPWSPALCHQSLTFRAHLCSRPECENEVPGEEAGNLICHKIFSEK